MKKTIVVFSLLIGGMILKVEDARSADWGPWGWETFVSSNVCLTTGTNMELGSLQWSTGSITAFNSYLFVFQATFTYPSGQSWIAGSGEAFGLDYITTAGTWTATNMLVPPIMLYTSTGGINGAAYPNYTGGGYIDFRDMYGNGKAFWNPLIFFKAPTDPGTIVSALIRRKR